MTDTTHRAFFGDGDRDFCLKSEQIAELEKLTGFGLLAIVRRFHDREASSAEILQVIRLALIGGGEHPQRAAELVELYVARRPMLEGRLLAHEIINAVWFGSDAEA